MDTGCPEPVCGWKLTGCGAGALCDCPEKLVGWPGTLNGCGAWPLGCGAGALAG